MSVHITSAVWKQSKAAGSQLLVLLSLADQAHDDGICWPSVGNIAGRCRLSERTVHRLLAELEDMGEIQRDARPGRSSIIRVLLGAEPTPVIGDTPVNLSPLTPMADPPDKMADPPDTGDTQNRKEPVMKRKRVPPPKTASFSRRSTRTGGPPTPSYAWRKSGRVDF
jgi:hypothetical protein